jgi:hypothetical protein
MLNHVHTLTDNPVLLIVDGHSSNRYLQAISYVQNNNNTHTTQKLRYLYTTYMETLKLSTCRGLLHVEGGNVVLRITEYDIAGVVNEAFIKVCRMTGKIRFSCTAPSRMNRQNFNYIDILKQN